LTRRLPRLVALLTLLLAVARCGSSSDGAPDAGGPGGPGGSEKPVEPTCTVVDTGFGAPGEARIRVERVADGLVVPWALAFLPGGDVLVTERPGRVRLLRGGVLEPAPVLTIPVSSAGEDGLLGIAADPEFEANRRFYLYYSATDARVNRVVRYVLAEDGRSAREDHVLMDDIPAANVHDGGRIRFGPDGMLHVATGDAASAGSAQDPASLAGKILRVTTDGAPAPGNPVPGSPVLVSGVRNVQGFDWLDDRTLAVVDHGPSGEGGRQGHDEISFARPGANLGWPDAWRCEEREGATRPFLVFRDAMPPGGAALYRGDAIPEWKGSLLVGTLRARHLQRVILSEEGRFLGHEHYLLGDPSEGGLGRLREVIEGPDGALWVTTSNCDGRGACPPEQDAIMRIVSE
jgi:aldose sugar dehydrogenase